MKDAIAAIGQEREIIQKRHVFSFVLDVDRSIGLISMQPFNRRTSAAA
jgi:hypothetical protein